MSWRGPRPDAGETLTELLVTVVILGIATAGISVALGMTVKASAMQRQQALAQNALRSWAEQIGAGPYTACATAGSFAAPSPAPARGLTAAVTAVQYWNGVTFVSSCGTDTGVQRVTLRVTAANGLSPALTKTVAVVVRKPCASTC
ncbi:MAG TPA: type II secretion system protein [Mycobacteriales bacterium]|nr:type II secretion system protein [Mycobacteriales bacterium]